MFATSLYPASSSLYSLITSFIASIKSSFSSGVAFLMTRVNVVKINQKGLSEVVDVEQETEF